MMKMDGRSSAEYQIWRKRDIMGIMEFDFKSQSDKIENSASSPSKIKDKNVKAGISCRMENEGFLVRESRASL